jgi:hypothetical protein
MSYTQRHNHRVQVKRWRRINTWSIKGPLLIAALLLGVLGGVLNRGLAPFAAGTAILIPIIGFRDYWTEWRFWITIALLALVQVPLVLTLAPFIERLKFQGLFAFGIIDCVLIAAAVSFSARNPKSGADTLAARFAQQDLRPSNVACRASGPGFESPT